MEKETVEYFRQILEEQRKEILKEAAKSMGQDISVSLEDRSDSVDRSSAETDRNFALRLMDRERKLLKKIDSTINKIDKGIFGICEKCGDDISPERLQARPVASLCIACKDAQENEESSNLRMGIPED